ncbi:di-trans,poly-cis-decaprenylcistransferase [Acidiferrimicrobium sp. IK]|uniref:polyprenyl diphosphate synthase n=1 Tax=Acidiferrimicrobium sp. IK TaxID=2871700 RepID=UPI0021CB270C|nr:polyprenyl diphosphate synthase [Acidiferrimicrobium sp. IK]MCU4183929.1 di-trans,poly-cis-decaprenylcistransferase [Acidiferrimicrobium sp. IK]
MDLDGLDPHRIPRHVACVMDGNGRWATKQGLPRTEGHRAGEEALFDAAQGALELGIPYFTVYAFSTENWRRPGEEVRFLLNVIADQLLTRRRDDLHALGVRIRFIGRRDWRVPRWVLKRMDEAARLTERNTAMTLTVAFNYGGRAEIVDAVRALVEEGVPARKIDEKAIARHLYDPSIPDPDLVIRTSGEYRISNFLIWELAYSELVFTDVLWPDFRRENLREAVREFQARDRRFGNTDSRRGPD